MNIQELQKEVYANTINLGYKVTKKTTLKKLKEEFKEFKKAKPCDLGWDETIKIIRRDINFKNAFNGVIKNTEHDEIPDMFFVMLSYCEENNIDFETLVLNKLRYNKLRSK